MNLDSQAENVVLELAVEDDYPVWEILWRLRAVFPHHGDDDLRRKALEAIDSLSNKGFVYISYRDKQSGELEKISTYDQLREILSDQRIWNPESSAAILIGSTDLGESHYYRAGRTPKR